MWLALVVMMQASMLTAQVKYDVKVEGLSDPSVKTVYLFNMETQKLIDSRTVKDGAVSFQGEFAEDVFGCLSVSENIRQGMTQMLILDGTPVVFRNDSVTEGSEQNKRICRYRKQMNGFMEQQQTLMSEYRELYQKSKGKIPADKMADLELRYEAIGSGFLALNEQVLSDNSESLVPLMVLLTSAEEIGYDKVAEYMKTYKYASRESLAPLRETLVKEQAKLPGAMVIDFEMEDLSGKKVHLTDYVGKGNYVLVDFWASWCGPCRQEMPHVKSLYEKYHPKGFEVVGVSLDRTKDAWKKGVDDLGIAWPQMSDLKYWQCEGARLYNIRAIPATILFAPDGTVVKAGMRGEELTKKLAEIYE